LKKRKTIEGESSLKDFTDSESESSDQSTPNDDLDGDTLDDEDSYSDMKLEVRDSPESYDALSRFPPQNHIQVADSYFFLKTDFLHISGHHLIHGPFSEVDPEFQKTQNSEPIGIPLPEFFSDLPGAFDHFPENQLLLISDEPEYCLKREDSSSSCMWADAILR